MLMCNGKCIRNVVQRRSSQCDSVFKGKTSFHYRSLLSTDKDIYDDVSKDCCMSEYGAEVKSGQKNVHDDDRSASAQIIKDGRQHSTSAGTDFGKATMISRCIR
jgi:hypothetical protein